MTSPVGTVTVRDARTEDRASVRALTLRAYEEYASIMTPGAWAGLERAVHSALESREHAHRLVAELDGVIVGSVLLFPPSVDAYAGAAPPVSWPEVRMLAVGPDARGLGVGQLLMDECVRRARADGAGAIGLHTSASMRAAMRLYDRMGFQRVPEYDFQPEGAELVEAYRLRLDATAHSSPRADSP